MTKLSKPLTRETAVHERSDAIVVELHPKYLEVRLKGSRESFNVDYAAILDLGRKLAYKEKKR